MKVIDLLNKIANNEEIPNKIKWGVHNFEWFVYEYRANDELGKPTLLDYVAQCPHSLNDEVEIIEEDKEIEKLDIKTIYECDEYQYIHINFKNTWNKINELIDEFNKLKRGDE